MRWVDLMVESNGGEETTRRLLADLEEWLADSLSAERVQLVRVAGPAPIQTELPDWGLQFVCGGGALHLNETPTTILARRYQDLEVGDVLLDPIWLPGDEAVQLLKAHTTVSEACLRRLRRFIGQTSDDAVMVAPASASFRVLRLNSA